MTDVLPQMINSSWGTQNHVRTGPAAPTHTPYDPTFQKSTHANLQAVPKGILPNPPSSHISVSIFNGSSGKTVTMELLENDTVKKVKELLTMPEQGAGLDLACNGKPVGQHQTLRELSVQGTVKFITYQKCHGG